MKKTRIENPDQVMSGERMPPSTPHITGTISWPKSFFTPAGISAVTRDDFSTVEDQLHVIANRREVAESPGTFPIESLIPLVSGRIVKFEIGPDNCVASYRIENLPMSVPLRVTVKVGRGFSASPYKLEVQQVGGPYVLTLAPGAPWVAGVDFAVFKQQPLP